MAIVLAGARIGKGLARHNAQSECVVESRWANKTGELRNCSITRQSKSSLRAPSFDSAAELATERASRKSERHPADARLKQCSQLNRSSDVSALWGP